MKAPESLQEGFRDARVELVKTFTALKQGKSLPIVNLIDRIQQKALQTLEEARISADMSFALIGEADNPKLGWSYRYGYKLGSDGKSPASLTAPHLEGFFDGQSSEQSIL
jgi:hypothetical protein